MRPCAVCRRPDSEACPNKCRLAFYCSKSHQSRDWPRHRPSCQPFSVSRGPWFRGIRATRAIPCNHLIFRERPLVVLPYVTAGQPQGLSKGTDFCCPGCCRISQFSERRTPLCAGCRAPLCSQDCRLSALHKAECGAMQAAGFTFGLPPQCKPGTDLPWEDFLCGLSVYRIHCADEDFKVKLQRLIGKAAFRQKEASQFSRLRTVTRVMFGRGAIPDEVIKAAILGRAWHSVDYECLERGVLACPLYYETAFVQHSCCPNVELVPLGGPHVQDFDVALRALRHIRAGEELLVCRTSITKPTLVRQVALKAKNIYCRCQRCLDPTEMGLYLGSLCCEKCRDCGFMSLLVSTMPEHQDAPWMCDACGHRISSDVVIESYVDVGDQSDNLNKLELEHFLRNKLFPFASLHKTHYHMYRVKKILTSRVYNINCKDKDALKRRVELLREQLDFIEVLKEGSSSNRGDLLLELAKTLLSLAKLTKDSFKRKDLLREASESSTICRKILNIWDSKEKEIDYLDQCIECL